jgi:hypothetical protein
MKDELWTVLDEELLNVIDNLPECEEFWLVIQFDEEETKPPISLIENAPKNYRLN